MPAELQGWVVRSLHEPRYGLAVLIGAVVGLPGVSYLLALHHLVASKTPAAIAVIENPFVPFASVVVRPQGTEDAIKRFKDWIVSHERQIAAAVALLAGAFMVISGTLREL